MIERWKGLGGSIMRKAIGAALAIGLLAATTVSSGHAETPRATLERFGFLGTWAQDCARPAATDNVWRQTAIGRGSVVFTESLGGDFVPSSYRVLDARLTAADTVVLSIKLNNRFRQELTMVLRGERIRTMTNRPRGAKTPIVDNGIVVGTAMTTPWLTRCGKQLLQG